MTRPLLSIFNSYRADEVTTPGPSTSAGLSLPQPLTGTLQEELHLVRKKRAIDAKNVKKLDPAARKQLQTMKTKKEMGRILLPDAPEQKRRRINSPDRVDCSLVPGTPTTPPKNRPQPWGKSRFRDDSTISITMDHDILSVDMYENREMTTPNCDLQAAQTLAQLATSATPSSCVLAVAMSEEHSDSRPTELATSKPHQNYDSTGGVVDNMQIEVIDYYVNPELRSRTPPKKIIVTENLSPTVTPSDPVMPFVPTPRQCNEEDVDDDSDE
ncbi:uncharacterized protein [Choristoneura fumiferana]|uniref:uncharacterized protein n=1 Tax=Choristoneura fumiferana TaxID=7141 RepID=UPI003D15C500